MEFAWQLLGVDDPERRYGLTAVWTDFNNDGKLDLFVTNDGQANYLYQGDGKGKFEDVALIAGVAANEDGFEQANMGLALGDYRHQGRMSLVISHFDVEYAALYHNEDNKNFSDESIASGIARGTRGFVGWGDAFVDFSNSGWLDFFLDGVATISDETVSTARQLFLTVSGDRERVLKESTTSVAALRLFESLPIQPMITVATAMRTLDTTKPTAGRAIEALRAAGVLVERTGRRRDRSFVYKKYVDQLSDGTELT